MPIYTVDSHILYHDRPSHEARGVGVASFPTLSISDAERRAYHNRRVSDALNPQRIFDTLWILVRSDLSRLAATYHERGTNLTPGRSHQGATLL